MYMYVIIYSVFHLKHSVLINLIWSVKRLLCNLNVNRIYKTLNWFNQINHIFTHIYYWYYILIFIVCKFIPQCMNIYNSIYCIIIIKSHIINV